MNTEVITLDPAKAKDFQIKRVNKHTCLHRAIEVDVEAREVVCKQCNTVIDPFEFIENMAMVTENHFSYMLHLQKRNEELIESIGKAEKRLSYLLSKEKRLNKKQ